MSNVGFAIFGRPIGQESISNGLLQELRLGETFYLGAFTEDIPLNRGEQTVVVRQLRPSTGEEPVWIASVFEYAESYGQNRPGGFVGAAIGFRGFPHPEGIQKVLFGLLRMALQEIDPETRKFLGPDKSSWKAILPPPSDRILLSAPSVFRAQQFNQQSKILLMADVRPELILGGMLKSIIANPAFNCYGRILISSNTAFGDRLVQNGFSKHDYLQVFDFSEVISKGTESLRSLQVDIQKKRQTVENEVKELEERKRKFERLLTELKEKQTERESNIAVLDRKQDDLTNDVKILDSKKEALYSELAKQHDSKESNRKGSTGQVFSHDQVNEADFKKFVEGPGKMEFNKRKEKIYDEGFAYGYSSFETEHFFSVRKEIVKKTGAITGILAIILGVVIFGYWLIGPFDGGKTITTPRNPKDSESKPYFRIDFSPADDLESNTAKPQVSHVLAVPGSKEFNQLTIPQTSQISIDEDSKKGIHEIKVPSNAKPGNVDNTKKEKVSSTSLDKVSKSDPSPSSPPNNEVKTDPKAGSKSDSAGKGGSQ